MPFATTRFAFAFATALCVAPVASASYLTCAETVNLQPSVVVEEFPASLTYDLTVTEARCAYCETQAETHWCHTICPGGTSSLVKNETDPVLESLLGHPIAWETPNPPWVGPLPFWLFGGESITTSVPLVLASYADCATRARNLPPPWGPVLPDASGAIVIPDTFRVEWNLDGVPPYFAECSAQLTCVPPRGQTRTLGYFKTHPQATEACLADAGVDLGFFAIAQGDAASALGLLYASPAKYDDGARRSGLDQARILLGRQLLVAICNGRVFGSSPADPTLVDAARVALSGTSCANTSWLQGQLDAFNNSGDTGENLFGNATPGTYPDPTPRTGYACR